MTSFLHTCVLVHASSTRRRERQEDLVKAKNQETLNRLTAAKDGGGPEASTSGRKVGIMDQTPSDVQNFWLS